MMRQIRVRLGRSGQDGLWMCGDPANVVGKLGLCIEPEAGDAVGGDPADGVPLDGFAEFAWGSVGPVESAGSATRW